MHNTRKQGKSPVGYLPAVARLLEWQETPPEQMEHVRAEMDVTQGIIIHTLKSFKIDVQPGEMTHGPRFTRYEFTVPQGKSVKSVAYRSSDIMAATRSYSIRIHTPIPGKPTVGIELENSEQETVYLREIVQETEYAQMHLPLALGRDVCGTPVVADLAELPHLLLSGAPGSGVPEGLRALLLSLLCKKLPQELELIFIDPSIIQLTPFCELPHLITPLITDVNLAARTLRWCIEEANRRYILLSRTRALSLAEYNADASRAPLPHLVVVLAELGHLMIDHREEMEGYLLRLTQKAGAVGIHLIIATQSPRNKVITDALRMHLPGRLAFRVGKAAESRTILDDEGAESLLGSGDALYRSPSIPGHLTRLQIPHTTREDVARVVSYFTHSKQM